jgi:hypothetical protein
MVVDTQSGGLRSASIEALAEASALKGAICEETVRVCLQAYGEQLRAIVLTGSLARDEATVVGNEGQWRLWGDAEFFLVFQDRATLPGAATLKGLGGEIESSLLQRKLLCRIGLSAVQARYFRRLQPHIFAYELRKWGTAVWGDSNVLALIPEFTTSEIPLEDAWRLLCNRVIELLEVGPDAATGARNGGQELRYRAAKLYLDMATSYLVFRGAYSPSYRERSEALSRLEKETLAPEMLPFSLRDFADRVAASTRLKITGSVPEGSSLALPQSNDALSLWKESLSVALGLWRWELARLAGVEGNRADSELVRAWMRRQPFSRRLRGWLYVARKRGWLRSCADWPRWALLAWRASPRYWIYAVTFELVRRYVEAGGDAGAWKDAGSNLEELRDWLPATQGGGPSGDAWHRLSAETAWNYHEYLEATRA